MEFLFRCTPYDQDALTQQLTCALETRMEHVSRQKHPRLWRVTDRLILAGQTREEVLRRRRMRFRVYGILMLCMGLFLLLPGLMEPEELAVPLVAGALTTGTGIGALWCSRKKRGNGTLRRAARRLLAGAEEMPEMEVRMDQRGMALPGGRSMAWDQLTLVVESTDLLLLFWGEKITTLQKKDMVVGDVQGLLDTIRAQAGVPVLQPPK